MTYILVLWTAITAGYNLRDWRPIAEFQTLELCEQAAANLNVLDRSRCIKTK